jgi:hypothetical protein
MRKLIALLLCACSEPAPSNQPDMAQAPVPDLAMVGGLTDAQRCAMACAKLDSCGAPFGGGCATACEGSNTFLPCLRTSDLTDCNALALCTFEQFGKDVCGGASGVPSGTTSCDTGAMCEAACNVNQPGVAACICGCVAGVLPARAINLLINNQCALNKCAVECGPTGSGVACNSCHAQKCVAESAQCTNN